MFLNAVILILQEILEAALLVSVLLALMVLFGTALAQRGRWLLGAVAAGLAGAALYGRFMPRISGWFDYVGLEVVNAGIQLAILACLFPFCFLYGRRDAAAGRLALWLMTGMVALSITREGAEVILYIGGILGQPENLSPVLFGGLIAAGIGISSGVLLYYTLVGLALRTALRTCMVLLALFAGNMAAQAVLLLTQADWLPYTPEVWNSSGWLQEYSVPGQLLYALVGYEANPSAAQAGAYLAAALLVACSPLVRRAWKAEAAVGGPEWS